MILLLTTGTRSLVSAAPSDMTHLHSSDLTDIIRSPEFRIAVTDHSADGVRFLATPLHLLYPQASKELEQHKYRYSPLQIARQRLEAKCLAQTLPGPVPEKALFSSIRAASNGGLVIAYLGGLPLTSLQDVNDEIAALRQVCDLVQRHPSPLVDCSHVLSLRPLTTPPLARLLYPWVCMIDESHCAYWCRKVQCISEATDRFSYGDVLGKFGGRDEFLTEQFEERIDRPFLLKRAQILLAIVGVGRHVVLVVYSWTPKSHWRATIVDPSLNESLHKRIAVAAGAAGLPKARMVSFCLGCDLHSTHGTRDVSDVCYAAVCANIFMFMKAAASARSGEEAEDLFRRMSESSEVRSHDEWQRLAGSVLPSTTLSHEWTPPERVHQVQHALTGLWHSPDWNACRSHSRTLWPGCVPQWSCEEAKHYEAKAAAGQPLRIRESPLQRPRSEKASASPQRE